MSTTDTALIAVVTGASRGAGAGIAHALGAHGATVYVTGRTENMATRAAAGTIHETAQRVTAAGGHGIPVRVTTPTTTKCEPYSTASPTTTATSTSSSTMRPSSATMMGAHQVRRPPNVIDTLDVKSRSPTSRALVLATMLTTDPLPPAQRTGVPEALVLRGSSLGPPTESQGRGRQMAADMAFDFRDTGIASISIWMGSR